MKINPKIYAQALIKSVENNKADTVASSFWYQLQKNNQYKDLPKIIDAIDQEFALLNKEVLVKVTSPDKLSGEEIKEISKKLETKLEKKVRIKNIVNKNQIAGITLKVDDSEIDLSLAGKIEGLKQQLAQ